jgi:hypothetical protein
MVPQRENDGCGAALQVRLDSQRHGVAGAIDPSTWAIATATRKGIVWAMH